MKCEGRKRKKFDKKKTNFEKREAKSAADVAENASEFDVVDSDEDA